MQSTGISQHNLGHNKGGILTLKGHGVDLAETRVGSEH